MNDRLLPLPPVVVSCQAMRLCRRPGWIAYLIRRRRDILVGFYQVRVEQVTRLWGDLRRFAHE